MAQKKLEFLWYTYGVADLGQITMIGCKLSQIERIFYQPVM